MTVRRIRRLPCLTSTCGGYYATLELWAFYSAYELSHLFPDLWEAFHLVTFRRHRMWPVMLFFGPALYLLTKDGRQYLLLLGFRILHEAFDAPLLAFGNGIENGFQQLFGLPWLRRCMSSIVDSTLNGIYSLLHEGLLETSNELHSYFKPRTFVSQNG